MREVVHVVLVEWSGDAISAESQAAELVRRHLPKIDGVVSFDAGSSVSGEGLEGGFDWMLAVRFRDGAALAGYLPHPEHAPVAEYLRSSSKRLVVFDIESDRAAR